MVKLDLGCRSIGSVRLYLEARGVPRRLTTAGLADATHGRLECRVRPGGTRSRVLVSQRGLGLDRHEVAILDSVNDLHERAGRSAQVDRVPIERPLRILHRDPSCPRSWTTAARGTDRTLSVSR